MGYGMVIWGSYFILFYYRIIRKNKTITRKEIEDKFYFPSLFLGLYIYAIFIRMLYFFYKALNNYFQ